MIEYHDIQDEIPKKKKKIDVYYKSISMIHDVSSSESSEYEDLKLRSSSDQSTSPESINEEESTLPSVIFFSLNRI
jgi:hypothetical protein